MIVKIVQRSNGRYHLFDGDEILVNPNVAFPGNEKFDEAEDDLGMLKVHYSFPENLLFAINNKDKGTITDSPLASCDGDFALVQIVKNKVFENIIVNRDLYDGYILENGKTIEHL